MLRVEKLQLQLHGKSILEEVSFDLPRGQTLCVVGESGSGKSSLLRAVNGLMPATFDSLMFRPKNGPSISLKEYWKGRVGLPGSRWVMQDPLSALNPKLPLGLSIGESVFAQKLKPLELKAAISAALADVELPAEMAKRRPAQVSMGQAQRACLARALIARPDLIFFDEPLSALDAIVQKQIAATMKRIQTRFDITFVIVTHDLGFAAAYADHMLVLRGGKVEANQSAEMFFQAPESDYCRELIAAAHELGGLPETVAKVSGSKAAISC
ncbi:dipeptide/oligopeptide/nickel ABC transporter ATP-binding protein [Roseibium porphyridii]|uniref:Dipeptide/oligopeptide/nickel ABC transporter ATP-binding protein n=1 Tax=Roseibium porphyridii TaxID=2866279 RepID=A0ABY8F950_9HYPH|nr:dipeptide/oligopeptide/nickel ABC transporter ATP-binding protein [Roseibium sp. KMA01]WFE91934.1 dipeptide/oligopeptide/nickel ABC transporter ATP-binding protein [Roseibium sp. KMA01]